MYEFLNKKDITVKTVVWGLRIKIGSFRLQENITYQVIHEVYCGYCQVVRATRAYQGSSSENSVSEHELLVVKSTKSKLTGRGGSVCVCVCVCVCGG